MDTLHVSKSRRFSALLWRGVLLGLLALVLVACGQGQEDGENQVIVDMERDAFVPQEITIEPGTTVVWENQDGYRHSVISGTPDAPTDMFNEAVDPGKTFSYTFDEVGTYDYFCEMTPDMTGTVIVEK